MGRIKMMTDSAADIPAALCREWEIEKLSFLINAGERDYLDGVDFTPQEFYRFLLEQPHVPTHSQLTSYVFEQRYLAAWREGYEALIYTSINAKGSATWQNAVSARESFYQEHPQARERFPIHVLDSGCYTMGYGWAVLQGAKLARQGASVQEVLDWMRDYLEHVRILFVPFDLKFARKSGRVSAVAAFVGEAMGLKPVMTFEEGASRVLEKVRGEKHVIPALLRRAQEEREPESPYLLIRANNPAQADLLEEAALPVLGEPALRYEIGGVIAINAGPNLIGMIYRKK